MIIPTYKTTKETKKRDAIEYVAGFVRYSPASAPAPIVFDLVAERNARELMARWEGEALQGPSDLVKAARKEISAWYKEIWPTTCKGVEFCLTVQGKGIDLSRSERKTLFAAMNVISESVGLSVDELAKLAA